MKRVRDFGTVLHPTGTIIKFRPFFLKLERQKISQQFHFTGTHTGWSKIWHTFCTPYNFIT